MSFAICRLQTFTNVCKRLQRLQTFALPHKSVAGWIQDTSNPKGTCLEKNIQNVTFSLSETRERLDVAG